MEWNLAYTDNTWNEIKRILIIQWAAKVLGAAKGLRAALPTQIWGTSRWARELIFVKWKSTKFWFRISNKKLTFFFFTMSFFNSKKINFFWLFFSLITCGEAKQFLVFSVALSWRAYHSWSSIHFSYDVVGKNFEKISSKVRFLDFAHFYI